MSFLVYYGHDPALIPRLRNCSTLVFEPRGWTSSQLAQLRSPGGPRLLGYLSPLAWPAWAGRKRWWWGRARLDPTWQAHWYSLASWGWRKKVHALLGPLQESCDGIFFDNLDRLETDPRSLPHLRRLLEVVNARWPRGYLMGNRGFANLELLRRLDGVLVENLSDSAFSAADFAWLESHIERAQKWGLDVYALDYLDRRSTDQAWRLQTRFPELTYYCAPDQSLQSL